MGLRSLTKQTRTDEPSIQYPPKKKNALKAKLSVKSLTNGTDLPWFNKPTEITVRLCRVQTYVWHEMHCTFCRTPLQSLETDRLASRENARAWMLLLSGGTCDASFMTTCIREFVAGFLGTPAWDELPHTALHAKRTRERERARMRDQRWSMNKQLDRRQECLCVKYVTNKTLGGGGCC